MAAGYEHSLFLMRSGEVRTCGSNDLGQLGRGMRELQDFIPSPIEGVRGLGATATHRIPNP